MSDVCDQRLHCCRVNETETRLKSAATHQWCHQNTAGPLRRHRAAGSRTTLLTDSCTSSFTPCFIEIIRNRPCEHVAQQKQEEKCPHSGVPLLIYCGGIFHIWASRQRPRPAALIEDMKHALTFCSGVLAGSFHIDRLESLMMNLVSSLKAAAVSSSSPAGCEQDHRSQT